MTPRCERGGALVAAIGVLSVMTLLATMTLMAGGADLVVARRLARERSAFYAAEAALETALRELATTEGLVPEASCHAPWPAPGIPVLRWQDGAWACARRVCLVPDAADADADPSTTVMLFDRSFGRQDSPLQKGGYPVFQLLVTAEAGQSRQAIVAEVTSVVCAPAIAAAWTAAGPLRLSGEIQVAGAANLPAVAGSSPAQLSSGAVIVGGSVVLPQTQLPAEVLPFLNAGATLGRLADLPDPPAVGPLRGLIWSRGDYAGSLDGDGILVVHNPEYDPVKHEASRQAIQNGVFGPGFDPTYSCLDASRQPACLRIRGGGSYRGVIVADAVGEAATAFTLTGALVTLSQSPLSLEASAPLRILGSRGMVESAGRGPLRYLTAFRPVVPGPGWPTACP